jgi:hypothetical protein
VTAARMSAQESRDARAIPPIERVVAELRETAERIRKLPQSSFRVALTLELNAISVAVGDLVARLARKGTTK